MKVVSDLLISICPCSLKISFMVSQYLSNFRIVQQLIFCLGYYTKDKPDNNKLDIVVVEATAITEDGWIVPGASVGATPELIQMADKIIIEVNTRIPSFEGLHDINMCTLPPNRKPYLIMNTEDRIGTVSVTKCDDVECK